MGCVDIVTVFYVDTDMLANSEIYKVYYLIYFTIQKFGGSTFFLFSFMILKEVS